jgi:hypothetical protein
VKLNTEYSVDTSFTDTQDFKIETSAKAFQILSGNIYKDVLLAIIRELSANAWDAHVSKGNTDVPFEITVPSSLHPELIIKDFGIGLSHEAMMQLFTTYFGSDKTGTNELIGGLGLGAKTPFAYTDSFTVVSRFSGVATTYACFLNDKKIPAITKITEEDCGDDTGLTIKIPSQDGGEVTKKLEVLQWYPTKPKINGGEIPELEPVMYQDKDVTVTDDPDASYYYRKAKVFVVMGYVPYNVGELDGVKFGHRYYFHEKIGTYDPAASRESLTDVSVETFRTKVEAADQEYIDKIGHLIQDPSLSNLEVLRLAQQNWKVLSNHQRVEGITKQIKESIRSWGGVLRMYGTGNRGQITTLKENGSTGYYRRRWQINKDVLVERILKRAEKPHSTLHIVMMPPKIMHCKMIAEHFNDEVDNVYSIETSNYQELYNELDTLLGGGICSVSDDWPVTKNKPVRKAKQPGQPKAASYSSSAYQDIYLEDGESCTEVSYADIKKYDTSEYFIKHFRRRQHSSPQHHWSFSEVRALARLLPCTGILWVPETELLRERFKKLGFVGVKEGIAKSWPDIPHLHTDYQKLRRLIENKFDYEKRTLYGYHGTRTKGHRLLSIGFQRFKDLLLLSEFSSGISSNGGDTQPEGIDESYKKDFTRFLARFRHKYPQHDEYSGKKLNDYMRYQDYEGSH